MAGPRPIALVTGAGGQDGWYLSLLLREKGYRVFGCGRPNTLAGDRGTLAGAGVELVEVDLLDRASTEALLARLRPDEVYNLAGHSFVRRPGMTRGCDSHHQLAGHSPAGVYPRPEAGDAAIPELFERDLRPHDAGAAGREDAGGARNPYAAAKVFAHQIVWLYRQHYGMFAVAGILYNHESPRRPGNFVTRKVVRAAVAIARGRQDELVLGDLDVRRDWGYAGDFVDAMWRMLQHEPPEDFVIGTGHSHSVRDLCEVAFGHLGLDYRSHVRTDPSLMRPGQPARLVADPRKRHACSAGDRRSHFASSSA